ncbi:MATE family efflux transporter [Alkaliphilus peptidifermentans]|uniref:Probable multidrug resistance protein NorM n=1 Tax=Alkaliphilus peptidifermentans DSM 18978 TaxID=1120976 RepID=A0A1G5FJN8_9FIRM|nr:MATE family efflux transporter [Alkaliphilus peptidifermentans]SCY39334.1 putative efflux protein, MATE family [Alkaliphilus peptidifermentans DSM 18978]
MDIEANKISQLEVRRKIYSMILPITVENVLQMMAGFVAMAMIGRIDTVSIAAVGISMRITQLIWAMFRGVTTGATVFVSQAYGANNIPKLKQIVKQTLMSAIVLVIIMQQVVYWNAPILLRIFGKNGPLLENGILYLRTVSWGLPFLAVTLVVAGILQGMGNAKTPMKIALIMNIINVCLNYVFIFGHLGFASMGLKGSAMATVTAQVIAAIIGLTILFGKAGVVGKITIKDIISFDIKEVSAVYRVGGPTAMESLFWQFSAIILTKIILNFGEVALAAYQLGFQAESISFMPAAGFGVAATAFMGQSLGANKPEMGKRYLKEIIKGSMAITSIVVIVFVFFPSVVMGLLTDQQEVIQIGVTYLMFMGMVQVPQNMSGVLNGALRGAGHTKVPMIVAAAGIWGIRIPLSIILTSYFGFGITAIWVAMSLDLIFRFTLSYTLFKRKNIYNSKSLLVEAEA